MKTKRNWKRSMAYGHSSWAGMKFVSCCLSICPQIWWTLTNRYRLVLNSRVRALLQTSNPAVAVRAMHDAFTCLELLSVCTCLPLVRRQVLGSISLNTSYACCSSHTMTFTTMVSRYILTGTSHQCMLRFWWGLMAISPKFAGSV